MANPSGIGGFRPGQSGNPGGRPRHPEIQAAQQAARKRIGMVIARMSNIVRRGGEKEATSAAKLILQVAGVPLSPESPTQDGTQPPASPTMAPSQLRAELDRVLEQ